MRNFQEFQKSYKLERSRHTKEKFYTLSGVFNRIFNSEVYWEKFLERESANARHDVAWLSELVSKKIVKIAELKAHQLALKNTNSTLTERSSFILIVVSAVSVLGLSSLNIVFGEFLRNPPAYFIAIIAIIISLILVERIRIQAKIAENEVLSNIIDKCI
ncbi:hypothetical protein SAMN05216600_11447 [Pseudomonas cuatrocienegasensis]|uniref:SMODS and SLOG-associating 2TM effector domain-containing protein n=1 Tax=Pseudomonas cuatrocienegasensis TaxID=543360 RepID=A0ABY1BKJ9_9PSED|nr:MULTISPECIES: hypothetical protein [Pseudomonas]SER05545.1 hypothetical protein SAMN05216600_11447 [Pseudomonas cuatrocienegasensis]